LNPPKASKLQNHNENIVLIREDIKADLLTAHRVASVGGGEEYLASIDRKQIRMHSTVVLLSKHDECCQKLTEKRDFYMTAQCAKKEVIKNRRKKCVCVNVNKMTELTVYSSENPHYYVTAFQQSKEQLLQKN
jgi:hypothetical protein